MRLFIGIRLPEPVAERLAMTAGGVPGARWIPRENLHLTLRFLGDTETPMAEDLVDELSALRAPAFDLRLAGVGLFGDRRRTRMLWAGVEPQPALTHLQKKVEQAAQRAGFEPERRKFHPHVTLARLRDAPRSRIQQFLHENGDLSTPPFEVVDFTLYRSFLSSDGARYEPQCDFELDPPADPLRAAAV
ncbi:MAG: 2'-5' RNA ligase [Rhizobiales bacterium NRL2]|jgi:2'-5' RNA ligase|nr:MAG: 2'-5' RNA ligase [Rhizobiales bacterium NRL2]